MRMLGGNPFVLPNTYVAGGGSPTQTSFETVAPEGRDGGRIASVFGIEYPQGPLAHHRRARQAFEKGHRFAI